jgi:hypothetical protein
MKEILPKYISTTAVVSLGDLLNVPIFFIPEELFIIIIIIVITATLLLSHGLVFN